MGQSWAHQKRSVGPTMASVVGPTLVCPLAQRWPTSGKEIGWPNVGPTVLHWIMAWKQNCGFQANFYSIKQKYVKFGFATTRAASKLLQLGLQRHQEKGVLAHLSV